MFAALAQGASHPAVAAWLGLGAAAVAAVVVAMAWSVNARQIRLAELLARRQLVITSGPSGYRHDADKGAPAGIEGAARAKKVPPEVIEGPDEVVAGEQARYRVQSSGPHQVVSWAVGGGPVSHAPDPGHPDDLLLIADQPGDLTIIARVREGLTERRAGRAGQLHLLRLHRPGRAAGRAARRDRGGARDRRGGWPSRQRPCPPRRQASQPGLAVARAAA